MRVPQLLAGIGAIVAIGMLVGTVLLGSTVGWVVETSEDVLGSYDVRGELAWMGVLALGVLAGAVLAARRPRHPIPWLLMAVGIGFLGFPPVALAVTYAMRGEILPAWAPYVAWVGNWIWMVGYVGGVYLLLLFPDGRPLSRRWGRVAWAGVVYIGLAFVVTAFGPGLQATPEVANPFGVEALSSVEPILHVFIGGFALLLVLAAICLVLRFLRSRGVERAQMKWMALAAAVLVISTNLSDPLGLPRWSQAIPTAFIIGAIVIAVTRYRLYEIDRIISRTVTYAVLSVVLVGVYVAGVVGIGGLVRDLSGGGGGDLVVAATTLVIAALFQPLRRRLQSLVDRRFNRARYDSRRTVEAFAQRLRDEVDLDVLARDLVGTASAAIDPREASLWSTHPLVIKEGAHVASA